jgi:xylose dehydrogenase (NAD/NADP)
MSSVTAASTPVTFGIASTATIAKNKAIPSFLAVDSAELKAISSRSTERAQAFADEHFPGGKGMTHDELLASDVDAVYVPLPSGVRNEFMKNAILSGKHIYSEKPHSGTVSELKSILDLAASSGMLWMDGTMWYHSKRTKAIEEKLKELGSVRRVSASFTWGSGLVDQAWIDGGNGRTDPTREPFGMLGDSGHYPISAVAWAFGWELPVKVQALHFKRNKVGAVITCEAFLWFKDGGRAVIDTSCECPHRSQFEIVCDKGVIKVDDLVGGQGRSGNFGAYESPFVGSESFVLGDVMGKDTVQQVEASDHENCLVEEFCLNVQGIHAGSSTPNPEWSKRALCTHTIMTCIFESCMRDGAAVEISSNPEERFRIGGEAFQDMPTQNWWE